MLCGVILVAAFTYAFAIPANTCYWKTEISRRGGATWTFDMKSGRMDWKWLVQPKSDAPRQKPVSAPASAVSHRSAEECTASKDETEITK
jgi:hypothetical protein